MSPEIKQQELLRGTPIREYDPQFSDEDYAVIARTLDEMRAARARRALEARHEAAARLVAERGEAS